MPFKNNYWKSLMGDNAQVIISGAVAYTSQADAKALVASGVQGELGCFDNGTLLLVSGGGAASTTENIFFGVKRDGLLQRTVSFQIGQLKSLNRTAYSAQVKQVTNVYFGGYASLVVQDITYYAKTTGSAGNAITITYVVAGASTALSVSVTGNAITVNLATNGSSIATSTATTVLAAIVASSGASALVGAEITGTAANVQAAQAATNLANGSANSTTVAAGNYFELGLLDLTPGFQPFPTWDYGYTAVPGDTIDTVVTNLAAQINATTSLANQARDLIVTATYDSTAHILTLTAINFGTSFRVLTKYVLGQNAQIVYTTPMHLGSGFGAQALLFEQQGNVFDGFTTNYPEQGANPADFGQPASLVNTTLGYNIYAIVSVADGDSKTPHVIQHQRRVIYILVPSSGTTPEVQVKAILGL